MDWSFHFPLVSSSTEMTDSWSRVFFIFLVRWRCYGLFFVWGWGYCTGYGIRRINGLIFLVLRLSKKVMIPSQIWPKDSWPSHIFDRNKSHDPFENYVPRKKSWPRRELCTPKKVVTPSRIVYPEKSQDPVENYVPRKNSWPRIRSADPVRT